MNANKIGVLGTGMVGATIATKLIALGYEVMMGSRTSTNEKATEWAKLNGAIARPVKYQFIGRGNSKDPSRYLCCKNA
jgi:predicted dinucleotide-binding enzyme